MLRTLRQLFVNDDGHDLVEYAPLMRLIALVVLSGVIGYGNNVLAWWVGLSGRIPAL